MATKVRVFTVSGKTVTESEVNKAIVKYLKLKQQEKQIKNELDETGKFLKEIIKSQKEEKLDIREHTISISPCEKKMVSYNALFEVHPRIAKKIATISRYDQLHVK